MTKLLLIGIGGGLGSRLRYLVAGWGQAWVAGRFPLGTFLVNVIGCAMIGFLGVALAGPVALREEYRLAILVGLLGGFTTFSTFGWEVLDHARTGRHGVALAYVLLSTVVGLLAAWGGLALAHRVFGR